MTDNQHANTLKNLIQKTQQALDEGWIHSQEYQDILDSANDAISEKPSQDDTYSESNGFHVLRHD